MTLLVYYDVKLEYPVLCTRIANDIPLFLIFIRLRRTIMSCCGHARERFYVPISTKTGKYVKPGEARLPRGHLKLPKQFGKEPKSPLHDKVQLAKSHSKSRLNLMHSH